MRDLNLIINSKCYFSIFYENANNECGRHNTDVDGVLEKMPNALHLFYLMVLINSHTISKSIAGDERIDDIIDSFNELDYTTEYNARHDRFHHKFRREEKAHMVETPKGHKTKATKANKVVSPNDYKVVAENFNQKAAATINNATHEIFEITKSSTAVANDVWQNLIDSKKKPVGKRKSYTDKRQRKRDHRRQTVASDNFIHLDDFHSKRHGRNVNRFFNVQKRQAQDKITKFNELLKQLDEIKAIKTNNPGKPKDVFGTTAPAFDENIVTLAKLTTSLRDKSKLNKIDDDKTTYKTTVYNFTPYSTDMTKKLHPVSGTFSRKDLDLSETAAVEALLNKIKDNAIKMITEQRPYVSEIITNVVTETTFEADPFLQHDFSRPGEVNSLVSSLELAEESKSAEEPTMSSNAAVTLPVVDHNVKPRAATEKTSNTLSHQESINDKVKKTYKCAKKSLCKQIRKEVDEVKSVTKKVLNDAKNELKHLSGKVGSKKCKCEKTCKCKEKGEGKCEEPKPKEKCKGECEEPKPKCEEPKCDKPKPEPKPCKPPCKPTRRQRATETAMLEKRLEKQYSTQTLPVTTGRTLPSLDDDYAMLQLFEEVLAKTHEDNVMKNLMTQSPPKISNRNSLIDKFKLSKRNLETIEDLKLKDNIRKIREGEGMPDDDSYEVDNKKTKSNENKQEITSESSESASNEDSSYEGLTNKISFNEYVDGYKHYLNFARELNDQNFSASIRFQAHKHHSVDDIGKYILNKIPTLPKDIVERSKRHFFDDSDAEDQDISTKSDESWFKKHFNLFLDRGAQKKYHTSQTVTFKRPLDQYIPEAKVGKRKNKKDIEDGKIFSTETPKPEVVTENPTETATQEFTGNEIEDKILEIDDILRDLDTNTQPFSFTSPTTKPYNNDYSIITKSNFIGKLLRRSGTNQNKQKIYQDKVKSIDSQIEGPELQRNKRYNKQNGKRNPGSDLQNKNSVQKSLTVNIRSATTDDIKYNKNYAYVDMNLITKPTATVKLKEDRRAGKIRRLLNKLKIGGHKKKDNDRRTRRHIRKARYNPFRSLKNMFSKPKQQNIMDIDYNLMTTELNSFKVVKYNKVPSVQDMYQQVPNITIDEESKVVHDVMMNYRNHKPQLTKITPNEPWSPQKSTVKNVPVYSQDYDFKVHYKNHDSQPPSYVKHTSQNPHLSFSSYMQTTPSPNKILAKPMNLDELLKNLNEKPYQTHKEDYNAPVTYPSTTKRTSYTPYQSTYTPPYITKITVGPNFSKFNNTRTTRMNRYGKDNILRPAVKKDYDKDKFLRSTTTKNKRNFLWSTSANRNKDKFLQSITLNRYDEKFLGSTIMNRNYQKFLQLNTMDCKNSSKTNKEAYKRPVTKQPVNNVIDDKKMTIATSVRKQATQSTSEARKPSSKANKSETEKLYANTKRRPYVDISGETRKLSSKYNPAITRKLSSGVNRPKQVPDYFNDLLTWHNDILSLDQVTSPEFEKMMKTLDEEVTTPNIKELMSEIVRMKSFLDSIEAYTSTNAPKSQINNKKAKENKKRKEDKRVDTKDVPRMQKAGSATNIAAKLYQDYKSDQQNASTRRISAKKTSSTSPKSTTADVNWDPTVFFYDDDEFIGESKKKNSTFIPNKLLDMQGTAPKAKVSPLPEQYFATPQPMRTIEFDKFLKENDIDVQSVTSPLTGITKFEEEWTKSRVKSTVTNLPKRVHFETIQPASVQDLFTSNFKVFNKNTSEEEVENEINDLNQLEINLIDDKDYFLRPKRRVSDDSLTADDVLVKEKRKSAGKKYNYDVEQLNDEIPTTDKSSDLDITVIDFDEKELMSSVVSNTETSLFMLPMLTVEDNTKVKQSEHFKEQKHNKLLYSKEAEKKESGNTIEETIGNARTLKNAVSETSDQKDGALNHHTSQMPNIIKVLPKLKYNDNPKRLRIISHIYKYDIVFDDFEKKKKVDTPTTQVYHHQQNKNSSFDSDKADGIAQLKMLRTSIPRFGRKAMWRKWKSSRLSKSTFADHLVNLQADGKRKRFKFIPVTKQHEIFESKENRPIADIVTTATMTAPIIPEPANISTKRLTTIKKVKKRYNRDEDNKPDLHVYEDKAKNFKPQQKHRHKLPNDISFMCPAKVKAEGGKKYLINDDDVDIEPTWPFASSTVSEKIIDSSTETESYVEFKHLKNPFKQTEYESKASFSFDKDEYKTIDASNDKYERTDTIGEKYKSTDSSKDKYENIDTSSDKYNSADLSNDKNTNTDSSGYNFGSKNGSTLSSEDGNYNKKNNKCDKNGTKPPGDDGLEDEIITANKPSDVGTNEYYKKLGHSAIAKINSLKNYVKTSENDYLNRLKAILEDIDVSIDNGNSRNEINPTDFDPLETSETDLDVFEDASDLDNINIANTNTENDKNVDVNTKEDKLESEMKQTNVLDAKITKIINAIDAADIEPKLQFMEPEAMRFKVYTPLRPYKVTRIQKRHLPATETISTAKGVAALEIIVDLKKEDGYGQNIKPILTNDLKNSIQLHIAVPNEEDIKRSPTSKVRKVFLAKLSSPVDLEYQIKSYEFSEATEATTAEDYLTPGMYLLVESKKSPHVLSNFALRPIKTNIRDVNNDVFGTSTAKITSPKGLARVTLTKEFIQSLNEQLVKLYGNINSSETAEPKTRKRREQKPLKRVHIILWDKIKHYLGHDRVCTCNLKANQTMCPACTASDAIMTELLFEFDNIANYMSDHCTEIQTFFWMNPTGGRKLRDLVHRIDKNLNDYYKHVRSKCQGKPCSSFRTYIEKREFGKPYECDADYIGKPLLDDLDKLADDIKHASELKLSSDKNFRTKADNLVRIMKQCLHSDAKRAVSDSSRTVYSLDNINVNIICNKESTPSFVMPSFNSNPMSTVGQSNEVSLFNYNDDEFTTKKEKLFRKLFSKKKKTKKKPKREADQIESPLIADAGGSFWSDYIKKFGVEVVKTAPTKKEELLRVQVLEMDGRNTVHLNPDITATIVKVTPTTATDATQDTMHFKVTPNNKHILPRSDETTTSEFVVPETTKYESLSYNMNELMKLFESLPDEQEIKNLTMLSALTTAKEKKQEFTLGKTISIPKTSTSKKVSKFNPTTPKTMKTDKNKIKNVKIVNTTPATKNQSKTKLTTRKDFGKEATVNKVASENYTDPSTEIDLLNKSIKKTKTGSKTVSVTDVTKSSLDKMNLLITTGHTTSTASSTLKLEIRATRSPIEPIGDEAKNVKSEATTTLYPTIFIIEDFPEKYNDNDTLAHAKELLVSVLQYKKGKIDDEINRQLKKQVKGSLSADNNSEIFAGEDKKVMFTPVSPVTNAKKPPPPKEETSGDYTNFLPTKAVFTTTTEKMSLLKILQLKIGALATEKNKADKQAVSSVRACQRVVSSWIQGDRIISTSIDLGTPTTESTTAWDSWTEKNLSSNVLISHLDNHLFSQSTGKTNATRTTVMTPTKTLSSSTSPRSATPKIISKLFTTASTVSETTFLNKKQREISNLKTDILNIITSKHKGLKHLQNVARKNTTTGKEACDPKSELCVCDVQATSKHIVEVRRTLPRRDFEIYAKNISCYRYKKPPSHYLIQPWRRKVRRRNNVRSSETDKLFTTKKLRWDWIRNKRSLLNYEEKLDEENEQDVELHESREGGSSNESENVLDEINVEKFNERNINKDRSKSLNIKRVDKESNTEKHNIDNNEATDIFLEHNEEEFDNDMKFSEDGTIFKNLDDTHAKLPIRNGFSLLQRHTVKLNNDYFERLYKGEDKVYRKRTKKRQKRTAGDMKELVNSLKNLADLDPGVNEIYVMLGDTAMIECSPNAGYRERNNSISWDTNRAAMLTYDNVAVKDTAVLVSRVQGRNDGNYTCIEDDKVHRVIKLSVVTLPEFKVVFIPMYDSKDGCTYDDLRALQQLGPVMSDPSYVCSRDAVRIVEPICLEDKDDSSVRLRAVGVMAACPRPQVRCSAQCLRDLQSSLALLCAANAPILSAVTVIVAKNSGNKSLTPSVVNNKKFIVTHTLRRKDLQAHDEYHQLAATMYPGNLDIVVSCPAGYYLLTKQKICVACPANTYSLTGENTCYSCSAGSGSEPGSSRCRLALRHLRRYSWWWNPPCGYAMACIVVVCGCAACAVCALLAHVTSRSHRAHAPTVSIAREDSRCTWNRHKRVLSATKRCSSILATASKNTVSPSAVILARFFRVSRSSSRATAESQETKFEQWKEKNIPPPLPPIDFE